MVDCARRHYPVKGSKDNIQPPISDAETLYSQLSNNSDAYSVVPPNLLSQYEINFWYHGISGNPPQLMWRSDVETNPFPTPPPGTHFFKIPTKTVHGVFNTPLNHVWHDIAPRILELLKARGIKFSALQTVRFSIAEDGKDETFGPIVVWIAVRPNTTNAAAVRDVTPDILNILSDAQITGVVVEWYEAEVVRMLDVAPTSVEATPA